MVANTLWSSACSTRVRRWVVIGIGAGDRAGLVGGVRAVPQVLVGVVHTGGHAGVDLVLHGAPCLHRQLAHHRLDVLLAVNQMIELSHQGVHGFCQQVLDGVYHGVDDIGQVVQNEASVLGS